MKRWHGCLAGSLLVVGAMAERADAAPEIQFDQREYDFGTTDQVQSVTGRFTFKNTGDAELRLGKPKPACGCTVASLKPDTLPPGGTGELVFTLDIANRRGLMRKPITVPSNDPQKPELTLVVKVEVKPSFEASPPQINLGELRRGDTTNLVVTVRRTDGKNLRIIKTEASNPLVRPQLEAPENAGDPAARVAIRVTAEGDPRLLHESVRVYAETAPSPALTIPVHGQLVGEVVVRPERLNWVIFDAARLDAAQRTQVLRRSLTVYSTKPGEKLELRRVTSNLPMLRFEVDPIEAGKSYSVVAKLAEPPKEPLTGRILVETSLAAQPSVEIPVTVSFFKP